MNKGKKFGWGFIELIFAAVIVMDAFMAPIYAEAKTKTSKAAKTSASAVTAVKQSIAGKNVSILGDSISTYVYYNPANYGFYYSPDTDVDNVNKTWWVQAISMCGANICSNASCSGTPVCGMSDDPLGRAGCSTQRVLNLTSSAGVKPDVVLVYMGMNDLNKNIPLGNNMGLTPVAEGAVVYFSDAYSLMLDKIRAYYPSAQIYCITFNNRCLIDQEPVSSYVNSIGLKSEDYNNRIKAIAANKGAQVIDVFNNSGITRKTAKLYTYDGMHPNAAGSSLVAACVRSYFQ